MKQQPTESHKMFHDPEFPFTVVDQGAVIAKFRTDSDAEIFAERIAAKVIETSPDSQ